MTIDPQYFNLTRDTSMFEKDIPYKWVTNRKTRIKSFPIIGRDQGGANEGTVFYVPYWLKNNWLNVGGNRWIDFRHINLAIEQTEIPTESNEFVFLLDDYELSTKFKSRRNRVPQTVRFIHPLGGNIKADESVQRWTFKLNQPGLIETDYRVLIDTFNRKGEKYLEKDGTARRNYITGEGTNELPKHPIELSFARNKLHVLETIKWTGGLNIPKNTLVYHVETLDAYNLPEVEDILDPITHYPKPEYDHLIHSQNVIVNGYTNPYIYRGGRLSGNPPTFIGFMSIPSRPMFIEAERCKPYTTLCKRFNPEMI